MNYVLDQTFLRTTFLLMLNLFSITLNHLTMNLILILYDCDTFKLYLFLYI